MFVLKVAYIGLWKEMFILYVRDRLSFSLLFFVNDYLYEWMFEVGWKDVIYSYIFVISWNYLMVFNVFCMGVRRNNVFCVRVG